MTQGSGWDYPSGSEVVTICGEDDDRALAPASSPYLGGSYRASGRVVDPIRIVLWTLTLLLTLCVAVLALASLKARQAESQVTSVPPSTYPMQIVFGDRGTNVGSPYGPNGTQSACTDETFDGQSGAWSCVAWSIDQAGLPIAAAAPYDAGPCSEKRVDQSTGHWVCVQSGPVPATAD